MGFSITLRPRTSPGYTGSHRSVMLFLKNTITALTLTAINAAKNKEKGLKLADSLSCICWLGFQVDGCGA